MKLRRYEVKAHKKSVPVFWATLYYSFNDSWRGILSLKRPATEISVIRWGKRAQKLFLFKKLTQRLRCLWCKNNLWKNDFRHEPAITAKKVQQYNSRWNCNQRARMRDNMWMFFVFVTRTTFCGSQWKRQGSWKAVWLVRPRNLFAFASVSARFRLMSTILLQSAWLARNSGRRKCIDG